MKSNAVTFCIILLVLSLAGNGLMAYKLKESAAPAGNEVIAQKAAQSFRDLAMLYPMSDEAALRERAQKSKLKVSEKQFGKDTALQAGAVVFTIDGDKKNLCRIQDFDSFMASNKKGCAPK